MARPATRDLTAGPIAGHFRALALPAALGMLFSTLYNVVDMYFAGLLSTDAQAGLTMGFQVFFILVSVGIGLSAAMGALVGTALGQRNARSARRTAAQGVSFAVLASALLCTLGYWSGPAIIHVLSEPGSYREAAIGYFRWLLLALPGFLIAYASNGIQQAQGDSASMQRAMMVAFFANIGLNPLLIYGIPGLVGGMGFNGIAASTVLSQTGVMLFMLRQNLRSDVLIGLRLRNFTPRPEKYRSIAAQSLPTTFAMLIMFLSGFVVQFALKGFGEHAIAGFGVGIRIEQILLLPVLGMTTALLPILSQNIGARDFDRTREALFFCWKVGWIITLVAAVFLWSFGEQILSLFTSDPEVIRVGLLYLRIDSLILPFYMMLFSINSLLQALKRPIWSVWIGLYRQGFGVAFFAWIFIGVLGFDEAGVWYGTICAVVSGWVFALWIAARLARHDIGGLRISQTA
ncbi:MAG: MATE family efflux transporter [Rhodobacteraceae bacterium]|nr:MATE family efflux transporter [Paracoccaceae bacterium]